MLTDNSLTKSFDFGIADHSTPDLTHYSDGVYVRTYSIEMSSGLVKTYEILFLDGDCGLCHRLTVFMTSGYQKKQILAINYSDDAQKVIMTMPEKFIAADTVYLIRNDIPYMKSSTQ